ncbi:MAG: hypothetical protein KA096_03080 [Bacteroidales bacterium]|nr:hypothetical protein [Bacteroidales bacterium]
MCLDFFQLACQEPAITSAEFGLCDDQNGGRAYTDILDHNKWIATVKNNKELSIIFTAIDKCVIQDNEYPGRGRCDCMLTTSKHLYFVELKDKFPPWQAEAIEQLESTVQFLLESNHDISQFKLRKAYASNKKRDQFVVIDNETNASFFRRTSFRLDIQAEVVML